MLYYRYTNIIIIIIILHYKYNYNYYNTESKLIVHFPSEMCFQSLLQWFYPVLLNRQTFLYQIDSHVS